MQDCLGRGCARGRRASARPEQPGDQATAGLHRQERAVDRPAPCRIACGTRADPLIGPRGTEGIGAHPVSPVRGRSIGSSTGIHDSAYGRMNGWDGIGRRKARSLDARKDPHVQNAWDSVSQTPQGRPAARRDAGAASMSEDFASRKRCGTQTMPRASQARPRARTGPECSVAEWRISREDEPVEAGSKHTRMAGVCGLEPQALGFGDRCSTN